MTHSKINHAKNKIARDLEKYGSEQFYRANNLEKEIERLLEKLENECYLKSELNFHSISEIERLEKEVSDLRNYVSQKEKENQELKDKLNNAYKFFEQICKEVGLSMKELESLQKSN